MRGKAALIPAAFAHCWITPAYAGKRQVFPVLVCIVQDHPRVCGEKIVFDIL